LGHASGDDATEALAAHEFQQRPRAVRMKEMLDSDNILNMSAIDKRNVQHLMDDTLNESVHAYTQNTRGSLFAAASLLPSNDCDGRTEAAVILGKSIEAAGKKRKFDECEDFYRAIMTDLPRLFTEQGLQGVTTRIKYLHFICDVRASHGWAAADFYHWKLQLACSDGEHDMVRQGHYNHQIVDKLRVKYPRKGPNGRASTSATQSSRENKFCSYHGHHREHTTDACKALQSTRH